MNELVLDSSILIAVLRNERFDGDVLDILEGAVMSTVNYAEVWTKLYDLGLTNDPRVVAVFALLDRIEPFTLPQSRICAQLRPITKPLGLSLGDRACLALALELGAEIYTADRVWAQVDAGCIVHLIR